MTTNNQATPSINIMKFPQNNGLYFEFQNTIKNICMDWNLIAYTDLTLYSSKYEILKEYYDATTNICLQLSKQFEKTDLPLLCQQFARETIPYLYEIESNHNYVY
jgi:hypothetical protein